MISKFNFLRIYKETEDCMETLSVDTLLYLFNALRDNSMAQCIVYRVLQSKLEGGVDNAEKF